MNFCDIPMYNVLPEVEDCVTEILLQNGDRLTMLGHQFGGIQDVNDLHGTKYEDVIPAYLSCREGESFGMRGTLFDFRLTEAWKAHIRKLGLIGIFAVGDRYLLENLTLYRGEKLIFTCCSHEAFDLVMPELTDELAEEVLQSVKETIERTELFSKMQSVNDGITKSADEVEKDLAILSDLCCYVDQAKGWVMYQSPEYKCDFDTFCKIAKHYLTQSAYAILENADGYADLQPLPVPQAVEEILADSSKTYGPHYRATDNYWQIQREISMLRYVRQNNGLDNRV